MRSESLWYVGPGRAELRAADVPEPADGQVRVRALYSGVSRGTERLILNGGVPASEFTRMRCPHQEGAFPFPVKYGYALVGAIETGPRTGETIFALHPHQRHACLRGADAHALPVGLPPRRACLAANMETALNVCWDAEIAPAARVMVIGGGVLGLLAAFVAARTAAVTVIDIDPARAALAGKMGASFCLPEAAPGDQDFVVHTSATEAGLRLALRCAAVEGRIVEASWYGDKAVTLPLGEAFHSRRLRLISSQVGMVAPSQRERVSRSQRLSLALEHLQGDALDALITAEIPFQDAPARLPADLAGRGLMTILRY